MPPTVDTRVKPSTTSKEAKPSAFKRAFMSPFVLLVLMLIVVDVAVLTIRSFDSKNQFQQNPRITAIRKAIETGEKPDVLVLGDSLIYSALYFADFDAGMVKPKENDFTYLDARLFSKLLNEQYKNENDVLNLSVPGGSPTDAHLLLKEMIAQGKAPKLALYGVSPRAMADNLVPNAGAIGGKLVLNVTPTCKTSPTWNDSVEHYVRRLSDIDAVANALREYGQLGDAPSVVKLRDFWVGTFWQYYHDRTKIQTQLSDISTRTLKPSLVKPSAPQNDSNGSATAAANAPPTAVLNGKKKKVPIWRKFNPERFAGDIENYKVRYNPPNFKKFDKQSEELAQLARLCVENDVQLLIVNMPITKANKSLIAPDLYQAYINKLNALGDERGITFIDMSSSEEFTKESFIDSVHLNSIGAQKFEHSLVSSMTKFIDLSKL